MFNNIYKLFVLPILSLASLSPTLSYADNISEHTVKAAFIYNFARFTQWPDDTDELKICIYGKDSFGSSIDKLNGKKVNDRAIRIIRTKKIEEVRSCHIAFLNIIPPEKRLFDRALANIEGYNILTISDADDVIDFGIMIGLKIDNNKVAFDVNHTVAKASGIEISAKLLRLANEVN